MVKSSKKLLVIIVILFLFVSGVFIYFMIPKGEWQQSYIDARVENDISDEYIAESQDFDFENEEIQQVLQDLESKNFKSVEGVIMSVGDYVYKNVEYNQDISYDQCISNSASTTLIEGVGQCSTMVKANIAILRGLGIAARPIVGCTQEPEDYSCMPLSIGFIQAVITPQRDIKISPITFEDGIALTKGGLHSWVEVWIPERGWVILEPTTGYLVDKNCVSYDELLGEPSYLDLCGLKYSSHRSFIDSCADF